MNIRTYMSIKSTRPR